MDTKKQENNAEDTVISPLAHDRTYGEVWYNRVFNWGANYWANLLLSAGFSQWAEHATRPIQLPFMKDAATPREIQQNLANWFKKSRWMNGLYEDVLAKDGAAAATQAVAERSMARARSLTLLLPGFAVMIPSVWLGAKIKPWFVEKLNRSHYGDEAMDDPSLKARHQAIEAEDRPTFLGTMVARLGTVVAVQATAQLAGSDKNLLNQLGAKNFKGVDPVADGVGRALGGSVPAKAQAALNRFAGRHGLSWSEMQHADAAKIGKALGNYSHTAQDFGSFVARDTIYTMVSAFTIHPLLRLLPHVPLLGRFMTYKPNVPANSPIFEGERIHIPSRPLRSIPLGITSDTPETHSSATPSATISSAKHYTTMGTAPEQHIG